MSAVRQWHGAIPHDILVERQVEEAIAAGHPVPRWGWPRPGSYNGSCGVARVVGWQKLRVAEDLGLLQPRQHCSACGWARAEHRHTELYLRPLVSMPICRSCHAMLHRRFSHPSRWREFVQKRCDGQGWVTSLRLVELGRDEAERIAVASDIFAALRATMPEGNFG